MRLKQRSNATNSPGVEMNLDLRFADVGDTEEVVTLINSAFSVEKGDRGLAFTTRDRVSEEEVHACLMGGNSKNRWLVLETPRPEERMVAAAFICTGDTLGTGSVDILAVDPPSQGKGIGSDMLRRAEGILLNFRCRFVRLRVSQWREDVLAWASKRGYSETGGGVWGELDGESADDLTRHTRYFVLTRDLLSDEKVAPTHGEGSAQFAAATAAAAERVAASNVASSAVTPDRPMSLASHPAVLCGAGGVASDQGSQEKEQGEEFAGLATFLTSVLKKMEDVEGIDEEKGDIVDGVMSDIPLRKANMEVDLNASLSHSHQPPLPPPPNQNTSAPPAELGSYVTTTTADQKSVSSTNGSQDTTLECEEISVARDVEGGGRNSTSDEEESVEHLLSSLIGALNTDNGRADFDRLTGTTVAPA